MRLFLNESSIWISKLVKQIILPNVSIIQSSEGLNRRKKGEQKEFSPLCFLPLTRVGTLMFSCPWMRLYTINYPGFQALVLERNYISGFPESLAWRRQIMRLLSLHNHVNQFLIVNLPVYREIHYIYIMNSLSLGNQDEYKILQEEGKWVRCHYMTNCITYERRTLM